MPSSRSPNGRHHSSSSSSNHQSSTHMSRSGKPLSKLNAGVGLTASALLAASAQASDELDRILRGEEAAQHRQRSRERSRTRSPHKAALAEGTGGLFAGLGSTQEDPFLVHTVSSTHTSSGSRHKPSSSSTAQKQRRSKHSSSKLTSGVDLEPVSSKPLRHRSKHRSTVHRSTSRSLSRTRREREEEEARRHHHHHTSSSHLSASNSQPHHSSSSLHRSSSQHRHRSRSHGRNPYPDGLAPPLQAVGGESDHELRTKFLDSFEFENGYAGRERRSPPMSPSRLDARAFLERERALEEIELRRLDAQRRELEYLRTRGASGSLGGGVVDPRYEFSSEEARRYDSYPRRDYGFDGGRLGPDNAESDDVFDLEDAVKPEPANSPDMTWAGQSGVLVCGLCQSRYEEPNSGANGGKVPRYLLCGHTFCTSCLTKQVEVQEDLRLATDTGSQAVGITPTTQKLGNALSLPCPLGTCAPTPLNEHGVMCLPVNQSYLDVSRFLRSRRAAGHGLKDTGIGRGDERGEEERVKELNDELEADSKAQTGFANTYALGTSLPCQQCQVHLATLFCQACNVRYCAACSSSVHVGRALSDHVKRGLVLPLNVARARGLLFQSPLNGINGGGPASASPAMLCPTHTDQPLSLYCRTCQVPVCRDCITPLFKGKHLTPGHDVDLLTTVLASTTSELKVGVQSVESTIARLERSVSQAASQVDQVNTRISEVRSELKDSFTLIRTAVLKALAEREAKLESELLAKSRVKESRIQAYRSDLAKLLISARAAHEEGVRVLNSAADEPTDIFAIKALLDVRAAINASASQLAAPAKFDAAGGQLQQQDVLLRVKPRELIRSFEAQIAKQGGVIASIPSEPTFTSFSASGTSFVLAWAPANLPVEGEVLEYQLEVCELPRTWRSKLRVLQPSLFPNPPEEDDNDEEFKWDGQGPLNERSRAAVNWLALPPGNVALGGSELIWKVAGGAGWAGAFTTLYAGEVTSVKHDNLNVNSAYLYRISVKNDLGTSGYTYSMPCTLPAMHLSYGSDMDSNGLVTYLGSNGGSSPWTNPTVANLLDITASSIQLGECASLTSRQAGTFQTLNRHLSWIRFDLSRGQPFRLLLSHYTLANCGRGVGVRRVLRNWSLQGSQNGIDWVTLREHVKDATLAPIPLATATWSITQPTPEPYRYVRILQTDVNHANDHHLALGQIEVYGWLVRD